jgi:hypothetical protein
MSRDVDNIVNASHDEDVAILVVASAVAGYVITRPFRDIFQISFVILPQCGQASGGQGKFDDHGSFFAIGKLVSIGIEDLLVVAGNRFCRRSCLDRERLNAHAVGGDGPAGFRLPPVIHHGYFQHIAGPVIGVGIEAFAREK